MFAQARLAARLLVRDRALLRDYVRWFLEGVKSSDKTERQLHPDALRGEDVDVFLVERLGGEIGYGPAWERLKAWHVSEAARRGGGSTMAGDSELGRVVYTIIRLIKPDAVIETGVATGVTSAHALAALEDNGVGVLHSIDLPPTDMIEAKTVGAAVPIDLRDRWTYHWGSAKRRLPGVLARTSGRRLFIHDSDHSYAYMSWEINTAWQALSPGDVIVCDDIHFNSAFEDVAAELGAESRLIAQHEKAGTTGVMLR